MTIKDHFRAMLRERKHHPKGSHEYEWRTNAARKYAWMLRGVPASQWGAL